MLKSYLAKTEFHYYRRRSAEARTGKLNPMLLRWIKYLIFTFSTADKINNSQQLELSNFEKFYYLLPAIK